MTNMFFEKLQKRWDAGARVCIGLDSEFARLPASINRRRSKSAQTVFNSQIISATKDLALMYKPNIAFYPGHDQLIALGDSIEIAREDAPDVPVTLDSKRGDIGNTNRGYVIEAFDIFEADAVTVSPYFGKEALSPFLERDDKTIIVLCRTSNPGAGEFQDCIVHLTAEERERWGVDLEAVAGGIPLYAKVAYAVSRDWNKNKNCALVVGATAPSELAYVRRIVGDDMPILIPGIGKQGGDVETSVKAGVNSSKSGIIVNVSSGIIFASSGDNYADAAREATLGYTGQINDALATIAP